MNLPHHRKYFMQKRTTPLSAWNRLNALLNKHYDFVHNLIFFLSLGYGWRKSWAKARDTL